MNNNPNNNFNNEEKKPTSDEQLSQEQMAEYIKEIEELKSQLPDRKAFERISELIHILSDYFSPEVLETLFGVDTSKLNTTLNISITERQYTELCAKVLQVVVETDYPEYKEDFKVLNFVSSMIAGIWAVLKEGII